MTIRRFAFGVLAGLLVMALGACSGEEQPGSASVRVVDAQEAAAIYEQGAEGLVVLDVRTSEEFTSGHLDDAIMIDFYAEDFADQLAALDPDVPYLIYCRSGNRSGQARAMMQDLGFADVADIDGGVLAWNDAGLPLAIP